MKRTSKWQIILSILLLTAVLFSFATANADAAGGRLSITSTSKQAVPGEKVTVYVKLDSNPGIIDLSVAVTYGSNLTLISASDGKLLPGYMPSGTLTQNPYKMGWQDSVSSENYTNTGTLATLVFAVSENAQPGDVLNISIAPDSSLDFELNNVSFVGSSSTIDVVLPSHEHVWDSGTTTPATCTKDGKTVYKCTVAKCTETKTEPISATGHKWNSGTVTTQSTCTKDGVKTIKCTNSNCTETKTEPIPATGHKWNSGTVTTQPTCTKDGVKTINCTNSNCTETKTEPISATGHKWSDWTQDSSKDTHTRSCQSAGCTASETTPCTVSTANCKDKAKCKVCGKEYGALDSNNHADLEHFPAKAATKFADGNIEYWYCSGCGKYYSDSAAKQDIVKSDTVVAKLPGSESAPSHAYYSVNFVTNGGNSLSSITVREGTVINLNNYMPARDGYSFVGWYSDSALKNRVYSITIDDDTTVYAGWMRMNPNVPATGDNTHSTPWLMLFVISGAAIIGIAALAGKHKDERNAR